MHSHSPSTAWHGAGASRSLEPPARAWTQPSQAALGRIRTFTLAKSCVEKTVHIVKLEVAPSEPVWEAWCLWRFGIGLVSRPLQLPCCFAFSPGGAWEALGDQGCLGQALHTHGFCTWFHTRLEDSWPEGSPACGGLQSPVLPTSPSSPLGSPMWPSGQGVPIRSSHCSGKAWMSWSSALTLLDAKPSKRGYLP